MTRTQRPRRSHAATWLVVTLLALGTTARAEAPAPSAASVPAPASAHALFSEANARYFAGDWMGAAKDYADIAARFQIEDPVVYHNLGNACFRSGAYGQAILYYRRAQNLGPEGPLAEALERNLDAARRTLQARYRSPSEAPLVYADPTGIVHQITHLVSESALALGFGVLWLLLFALLALRRLRPGARWPGRVAVPIGVLVALAGAVLWARLATDADLRVGVVISADAMLRDGKHEIAQGKALAEGLEVRILDGDADWTQVELAGGRRGWVASQDVKQI